MLMIVEIQLRNLLSFGHDTEPLGLKNLNVLIGANGSGKPISLRHYPFFDPH
jgi:DNA repair exonuclease SbcCD ATPase subunit